MGQPYVGEIRMFGGNYAPAGWEFCNGQLLPISENETLFQLIGTYYGGDGESTFALPNLQSRIPLHFNPTGGYPLSQMGGAESVTLTTNQIPQHTHAFIASTALATEPTPGNNVPAQASAFQWFRGTPPTGALAPQTAAPAGGSQPHENMIPFLSVSFIISLYGIFPQPT